MQPMIGPLPGARVFADTRRPGLADCAPSGRIRLDALARWLQDVAYADVEDAGVHDAAVWVVRKTRIRVERFPRFAEHLALRTFCSGIGRMWAERRTTIAREPDEPAAEAPADVEAVSLWVHLDPTTWRPAPFTPPELEAYGASAGGRRISARLRHPAAADSDGQWPWIFRSTECDLADHINNAAYWEPLEQELLSGAEPDRIDVEVEFRTPAQPGEKRILAAGRRRWITDGNGEVHASLVVNALHPDGASAR
jgi:acyl-ACP thioesterase